MVRFMNTRVTVKRLRDGKLLFGWIIESRKSGQVHVKVTKGEFEPTQEPYELCLNSRLGSLTVTGVFAMGTADCAIFAVPKVIEIVAPSAASRITTPSYQLSISFDAKTVAGTLLDIANAGIGVRSAGEVPKGTLATIEIQAAFGRKSIVAMSTYSAPKEEMGAGWYRTGFKVDADSRLSQANWKYIFDFVVEQAIIEAQLNTREGGCASQALGSWRNRAA